MNAHLKKNQKSNDNLYIFETGDYIFIIELQIIPYRNTIGFIKKIVKKRISYDFEELRKFIIEEWNKRLGNYQKNYKKLYDEIKIFISSYII